MKMRLLNPGPVTLSPRVREALQRADLCHREPEFAELTQKVRAQLSQVYPVSKTSNLSAGGNPALKAVLLTGSGTAAVEAMIGSMIAAHETPLVLVNGVYGDRIVKMRLQAGRPVEAMTAVEGDWTQDLPWEALEKRLEEKNKPSHVVVIHHETTTGRLNDLARVGRLCRAKGIPVLVDAVSSFGAEEIDFDAWSIAAVAGTANKCLHGIPGISFVVGREVALRQATHSPSLVLDLARYFHDQEKTGFSPFTQSVQALFALDAALEEFTQAGGWKARRAVYLQRQEQVTLLLKKHGISRFLKSALESSVTSELFYSCVLMAYELGGFSYEHIHDTLKKHRFTVYAGQGGLSKQMFRISTMGDIQEQDLADLEIAFGEAFQKIQLESPNLKGLHAASH